MKDKLYFSNEEQELFRESVTETKKLPQDSINHYIPPKLNFKRVALLQPLQKQVSTSYYFSDEYQPLLKGEGPSRYARNIRNSCELHKLRRGDYLPDLFLDLHGFTQRCAKQELSALIATCKQEHLHCANIIHGHGKHILKQKIPLWLAQHPDVLAFHQAPKAWGGNAAILLLIELVD